MNKTIQDLEKFVKGYQELSDDLNGQLKDVDNLSINEFLLLYRELSRLKYVAKKVNKVNNKITKKMCISEIQRDKTVKSKLKDKNSVVYNNLLLHQGKAAKSISNIEYNAKKGDIESQFLIGKTYLYGVIGYYDEVKMKDVGIGLKWLAVAYKNGHLEAGFLIANYENSVFNTKSAIKMYETLSKKNHKNSIEALIKIYQIDPNFRNMEKVLELKNKLNRI